MPETSGLKKDRACDACRRRKIKCNGPSMPNNVCANCYRTGKACTYIEVSKPRGPSKAYITSLEDKLDVLEALLRQIQPGVDISKQFGPPLVRDSWKDGDSSFTPPVAQSVPLSSKIRSVPSLTLFRLGGELATPHIFSLDSSSSAHAKSHSQSRAKRAMPNIHASDPSSYHHLQSLSDEDTFSEVSSDDEDAVITSFNGRTRITLRETSRTDSAADSDIRFHGRNDTAGLIELTRHFKDLHIEGFPKAISPGKVTGTPPGQVRRLPFWKTPSWELGYESLPIDDPVLLKDVLERFPSPDVAEQLIECYFRYSNPIYPLLHCQTFHQQWSRQLHRHNIWFACVCMSLFAVASRWCSIEKMTRRTWNEDEELADWNLTGRHYFDVANGRHTGRVVLIMCLINLLRRNTSHPKKFIAVGKLVRSTIPGGSDAYPSAWVLVSVALRKAVDVGVHRKRVYRSEANIEDELWKRAFWILVVIDRLQAVVLGRSFMLGDEDFDVDLPLEVDDSHWGTESGNASHFAQLSETSLTLIGFNQLVKLTDLMGLALRTLYVVNRAQACFGLIALDRRDVVRRLSEALEGWEASTPEHLRWTNDMSASKFSSQSGNLFIIYHMTRLLIHRLAVTSPASFSIDSISRDKPRRARAGPDQPLADSSAQICTASIYSSVRILEVASTHKLHYLYPPFAIYMSHFCAAFILRLAWQTKVDEQEGTTKAGPDTAEMLPKAEVFLHVLDTLKDRWSIVGLLLEDLYEGLRGLPNSMSLPKVPRVPNVTQPCSIPRSRSIQSERRRLMAVDSNAIDNYALQSSPSEGIMSLPVSQQTGSRTGYSTFVKSVAIEARTVSLTSSPMRQTERPRARSVRLLRALSSPDLRRNVL